PCAGKLASTVPNGREKVVTSSLDPTLHNHSAYSGRRYLRGLTPQIFANSLFQSLLHKQSPPSRTQEM
ncbi:hypothetical protein QUA27_16555, partial [Microcoleus sp. Pol14C6]|uniref:hypothetical protein n=1 Tax=unclassified Microcoleus TaxID=2642155 RepID=UPI002FD5D5D4